MRLVKDPAQHKTLERWLAGKLVSDIMSTLEGAGVTGDLLKRLTTEVALAVAQKWEGASSALELSGERIAPFLVFGVQNDEEDVLVRNFDEMGSFLTKETKIALGQIFDHGPR